ncbi:Metallo-dependent phosphatase-like protein [Mycena rosella]|uniref:Metallo-dependent phosphatase-like protein n=1 Tax=Mycena rosella TaxID=1033263 RepID=A0AAD7GY61_MYCRO|nr:Metallo-dependent phosphatase-like protein [Mycena rosella]
MPTGRQLVAYSTLAFFCLFFLSSGLTSPDDLWQRLTTTRTPDFSRYTPPQTLSDTQFPIHDPHKRVIILGDVHGMDKPFHALLAKLSYDPSSDVLMHVGDIVAKGPHEGSMAVLSYMAAHNVTGVRGNHDQMVIEWRSWLDWIAGLDGGAHWLRELHADLAAAGPEDPEAWAQKHLKHGHRRKWGRRIPDGWKILSDHYRVAHAMSAVEYRYLLSLPLVLHVPAAHAFIAHGGILPSDPRYKPYHRRQPLARVPALPKSAKHNKADPGKQLSLLRRLQEAAVLAHVPQNRDPWVTLNIRGVLDDNSVTRTKDGEPWADIWNRDVSSCVGFEAHLHLHRTERSTPALPCYPATVVYGHAAARGLDVKRWSVGLDSGCVYNRHLSALVLDSKLQKSPFEADAVELDVEARKKITIPFGEGSGRVVTVSCKD